MNGGASNKMGSPALPPFAAPPLGDAAPPPALLDGEPALLVAVPAELGEPPLGVGRVALPATLTAPAIAEPPLLVPPGALPPLLVPAEPPVLPEPLPPSRRAEYRME